MLLVSERSLWYDGTRHVRPIRNFRNQIGTSLSNLIRIGRPYLNSIRKWRADSKISNPDVLFEFESNLEASQVPMFYIIFLPFFWYATWCVLTVSWNAWFDYTWLMQIILFLYPWQQKRLVLLLSVWVNEAVWPTILTDDWNNITLWIIPSLKFKTLIEVQTSHCTGFTNVYETAKRSVKLGTDQIRYILTIP